MPKNMMLTKGSTVIYRSQFFVPENSNIDKILIDINLPREVRVIETSVSVKMDNNEIDNKNIKINKNIIIDFPINIENKYEKKQIVVLFYIEILEVINSYFINEKITAFCQNIPLKTIENEKIIYADEYELLGFGGSDIVENYEDNNTKISYCFNALDSLDCDLFYKIIIYPNECLNIYAFMPEYDVSVFANNEEYHKFGVFIKNEKIEIIIPHFSNLKGKTIIIKIKFKSNWGIKHILREYLDNYAEIYLIKNEICIKKSNKFSSIIWVAKNIKKD